MAEFGDSQGNVYHDPVEFMLRPFFPEKAGTTEASLKDQGTKPPIAPKNSGMDFFRDMNDENQFPGNPPLSPVLPGINDKGKSDQDPNLKIRRVQSGPGNKESYSPLPEEDWKDFWNAPGSRNLSVGKASPFPLDQLLDQNPKGFLVERGHLGLHGLDPNKYEILEAPDQSYSKDHLFVRPKKKDAEVGEADIPVNARLTAAEGPTTTLSAMVDSFTNPNSNVPTPTNMAKAGFTAEHYNKVVNFLDNLSDMKGAENWSAKELIGYALSHGMNALGIEGPKGFAVKAPGVQVEPVSPKAPANENIPKGEEWRVDASKTVPDTFLENASNKEFVDVVSARNNDLANRIRNLSDKEFGDFKSFLDNKKGSGEGSTASAFIDWANAKNTTTTPTTPYDKAAAIQQARSNIKLVTENPSQEPQAGRKPSPEEIAMQYNQRQEQIARDKANKVNVGPGKGVLNDNADRVEAMQRAGRTTSEIAKAFDITPNAVRSWIKNQPEKVVAADQNPAAVKIGNTWYRGSSHADAMENAAKELGQSHDPYALDITDEGFFTNKGNYVSREKAFVLAKRHGQVETNSTSNDAKQLMSEDLLDSTGKSLTDRARETIERLNAAIKAAREKRD